MLDDDVAGLVKRLAAETPFGAAAALPDDIREVGPGGHFLGRRSTREGRASVWQPAVFRRGTFESHRDRTVVGDALERAHALLAEHEVTPLPEDVQGEIEAVIAAFRRGVS